MLFQRYLIWLTLSAAACTAQTVSPEGAEKELFAARYKKAAELYGKLLVKDPADPRAYYGLIRSLIEDHRSEEAYSKAAEALERFPKNASVQAAAGLAAYRKGDIGKAQQHFLAALQFDAGDAGALCGLASINEKVSRFKSARNLLLQAYRKSPGDPELMLARANTLKGAEHIAALREALAVYDPDSDEARGLRAHIADDIAVGDRKLRRLISPYEKSKIKLFLIQNGLRNPRGVGVRVQFSQHESARLMLDTGASGISVSAKFAERAGLEKLGRESRDAKGIGDKQAEPSHLHIAPEVRIGDVVFADYPISAFPSAKSSDFDGLIGADVFKRFLVTIDFPDLEIALEPRPADNFADPDGPIDASTTVPPGFQRVFRFGDHLAVPTSINNGKSTLFLIDSGSSSNLVDDTIARDSSKVYRDDSVRVKGIQGEVKQTSMADHVSLVFAGFRQDNSSLIAISLESLSDGMGVAFGGILGMPVLRQMVFTVDYQEGIVRFEYKRPLR
jgi:thioredoxin-like negative regulator of GroEL